MSKTKTKPHRERVEPNIYKRVGVDGKTTFEVVWRNSAGVQSLRTVGPKITAARAVRDEELARRGRREQVSADPRLTFAAAADAFMVNQAIDLREGTQASYRWAIEQHLKQRFGKRRLDRIDADSWALYIRDLRAGGMAEASIESILKAARRTYAYAERRLHWRGTNALKLLDRSERPKLSEAAKRRIFSEAELSATVRASTGTSRIVFTFAGIVGARISEALGLAWADLDLADLDAASVSFAYQLSRSGERVPLKTEESKRTIELPRSLAVLLAEHKAGSQYSQPGDFVFATRSGKPLSQRNVSRELRRAMKAATLDGGKLAFPVLSKTDDDDKPVKVPRGELPSFHSFRHSAASQAIAAGDGAEEVSWLLGHRDSTVTRRVYVQEIRSVERSAKRREKLEARNASVLSAAVSEQPKRKRSGGRPKSAQVVDLASRRTASK